MTREITATGPHGGDNLAPSVLIEFRRAQADVVGRAGTSYWGLGCGRLAGADYLAPFVDAIGAELVEAEFWTPAQVRAFARNAHWDTPDGIDCRPDRYWSARRFLETCAATGCGARFS